MKEAYMRVSFFLLLEICKNGTDGVKIVKNALPQDAEYVRAGYDNFGNMFVVLRSESFEDIKEGAIMPELPRPEFEKVYSYENA